MKSFLTPVKILAAFGLCAICLNPATTDAAVVGDVVTASNTFENPDFTASAQTIFGFSNATVVEPGVEFNEFVGIYDVDITEDSLTMTLVSNEGLSFLEYEAGTFDRYYFGFDSNVVDSASIGSGDTQLTNGMTVGLMAPGFELDVADLFGTGITVPIEYPNGGFFVEFGEGTNLETLGVSTTIDFSASPVPEPGSALLIVLAGLFVAGVSRKR